MAPRRIPQEFDEGDGPPPATSTSDRERTTRPKPIGVPEDYPIPGGAPGVKPKPFYDPRADVLKSPPPPRTRYMVGDELLPANYSADRVVQIQYGLERIGLLSQGNYSLGIWDPATMKAYKELLGLANARGQTAEQTLNEYMAIVDAGGGPAGDAGRTIPPLVVSKTPAEELDSVFRRAAIELTGRGWSSDEVNQAITAYNEIETQRQEEAYNAQYFGGGGEVEAIPSPSAFIQSRITQQDPEEVAVESGLGFIGDFLSMAGGSGWGGSR